MTCVFGMVSAGSAATPNAPSNPQRGDFACEAGPLPARPQARSAGRLLDVRSFGTVGDGLADDTAALRRALAALRAGDTLRFPAGTYRHDTRLVIDTTDVTLEAQGATLHASNPADQALLIQANGVRVLGFRLTALTDHRRDAPWESRIAVWRHGEGLAPLTDIHIRDNLIVESGEPGSARANSSSSAAIFIHNARRFTVAGNTVRRSLADAIHITGGSSEGRVIGNTVRDSGDDMVAVVSYQTSGLVRDVLIASNDLRGAYWGRGITVVGGEAVTVRDNSVDATTHAAGIYIAREAGYRTHGVRNVRVEGNRITRVQSSAPTYSVLVSPRREARTGHAAIEVVTLLSTDESRLPAWREALSIQEVALLDNTLHKVATDGIRIGDRWGRNVGKDGFVAGRIDQLSVHGNLMHDVRGEAIAVLNAADPQLRLHCASNQLDSRPVSHRRCAAAAVGEPVRGSTQPCLLR